MCGAHNAKKTVSEHLSIYETIQNYNKIKRKLRTDTDRKLDIAIFRLMSLPVARRGVEGEERVYRDVITRRKLKRRGLVGCEVSIGGLDHPRSPRRAQTQYNS